MRGRFRWRERKAGRYCGGAVNPQERGNTLICCAPESGAPNLLAGTLTQKFLGSGNSASYPVYVGDFVGDGAVYAATVGVAEQHPFYVVDSSDVTLSKIGGGTGSAPSKAGE